MPHTQNHDGERVLKKSKLGKRDGEEWIGKLALQREWEAPSTPHPPRLQNDIW